MLYVIHLHTTADMNASTEERVANRKCSQNGTKWDKTGLRFRKKKDWPICHLRLQGSLVRLRLFFLDKTKKDLCLNTVSLLTSIYRNIQCGGWIGKNPIIAFPASS